MMQTSLSCDRYSLLLSGCLCCMQGATVLLGPVNLNISGQGSWSYPAVLEQIRCLPNILTLSRGRVEPVVPTLVYYCLIAQDSTPSCGCRWYACKYTGHMWLGHSELGTWDYTTVKWPRHTRKRFCSTAASQAALSPNLECEFDNRQDAQDSASKGIHGIVPVLIFNSPRLVLIICKEAWESLKVT